MKAIEETGLDTFPESPCWTAEQMLEAGWLPEWG